MINNRLLSAFCMLAVLCSWQLNKVPSIEKASWVVGTWENKTSKGSTYETWTKISDSELAGKSYSLKTGDTLVFESLRLVQKEQSLFYIPTVKNQNNNLPVSFSLKSISDSQLVFENAKHDFPQIISYQKITTDSLVAEISGVMNGRERKQTYPMKRIR